MSQSKPRPTSLILPVTDSDLVVTNRSFEVKAEEVTGIYYTPNGSALVYIKNVEMLIVNWENADKIREMIKPAVPGNKLFV